jgi:hypothetical protein
MSIIKTLKTVYFISVITPLSSRKYVRTYVTAASIYIYGVHAYKLEVVTMSKERERELFISGRPRFPYSINNVGDGGGQAHFSTTLVQRR